MFPSLPAYNNSFKARMTYNWNEGEDITEACRGRSGLYPATKEGRKQAMADLQIYVVTQKDAKAKPAHVRTCVSAWKACEESSALRIIASAW